MRPLWALAGALAAVLLLRRQEEAPEVREPPAGAQLPPHAAPLLEREQPEPEELEPEELEPEPELTSTGGQDDAGRDSHN